MFESLVYLNPHIIQCYQCHFSLYVYCIFDVITLELYIVFIYIYIIQECMYIFKSDVYIYIYTRKYTCDGRHQCSRKQDVVFLEMLEMSGNLLLV